MTETEAKDLFNDILEIVSAYALVTHDITGWGGN